MFSRSADHAEISPPAVVPEGPAAPGPPPRRSPQQRHFDWIFVAVVVILVGGAIGVLLFRNHTSEARAARVQARADASAKAQADASASAAAQVEAVKQAYLAYWTALGKAYLLLSTDPLDGYTTPANLQQQGATLAPFKKTGFRYLITADHEMQIVVYRDGQTASIDDTLVQHLTPVDAISLQPTGSLSRLTIHASNSLVREEGHWVVDSQVNFGTDGSTSASDISYVAANRDHPIAQSLSAQIEASYLSYWQERSDAFERLDPEPLLRTALNPLLARDLDLIAQDHQKHRGFHIDIEHNLRIGLSDDKTAFVYDTFLDNSTYFDFSSKVQLPGSTSEVVRESYEFTKVGDSWRIKDGSVYK